ncbi:MAG: hypothetical protein R3263_12155, partial [Myxococcota bacterium]|nr:hypothetical protein [Myxococcota bacterium]
MGVAGFPELDFDGWHRDVLPDLLARGRGAEALRGLDGPGSLALRLPDGRAWTYAPGPQGLAARPGDEAADTVVELDADAWQGLVHDVESAPGLLYAGRVRCL